MKHLLLTVGKPKADYIQKGLKDYAGRLRPHGGLEMQQVKAARAGKNTQPAQLMADEGQRLLERLGPRDQVWALHPAGEPLASEAWAQALEKARMAGKTRLVLLIGGAEGLDQAVLARADLVVSLGPPTLPHELAALVAAEQLYRAHTIIAGLPYHRA